MHSDPEVPADDSAFDVPKVIRRDESAPPAYYFQPPVVSEFVLEHAAEKEAQDRVRAPLQWRNVAVGVVILVLAVNWIVAIVGTFRRAGSSTWVFAEFLHVLGWGVLLGLTVWYFYRSQRR